MQQHDDHKTAADDLSTKATAAGLTDLATAAKTHASASVAAAQAFASGDVAKKAKATVHLLRTAAAVLDHVDSAAAHPEVIAAGQAMIKHLGEGLAASV